jgi:hypothetical protein
MKLSRCRSTRLWNPDGQSTFFATRRSSLAGGAMADTEARGKNSAARPADPSAADFDEHVRFYKSALRVAAIFIAHVVVILLRNVFFSRPVGGRYGSILGDCLIWMLYKGDVKSGDCNERHEPAPRHVCILRTMGRSRFWGAAPGYQIR